MINTEVLKRALDLKRLVSITAIAESRSLSGAAKLIGVNPAWISSQLNALEQQLGNRLFTKSDGGLEPTVMGELIIASAYRILDAELDLLVEIDCVRRLRDHVFTIGANEASAHLPERTRLIEVFADNNPQLSITVVEGTSNEELAELRNGGLDAAIVSVPLSNLSRRTWFRSILLRESKAILVMRMDHALNAIEGPLTIEHLAGERVSGFPRELDAELWDRLLGPLAAVGAEISSAEERSSDGLVARVVNYGEVTIVADWIIDFLPPHLRSEIAVRPFLEDVDVGNLCLVVRAHDKRSVVHLLVSQAENLGYHEVVTSTMTPAIHHRRPLRLQLRRLHQDGLDQVTCEILLAITKYRSFTRAASSLYLSQPWVSTKVRSLEVSLGFALFDRTPSGVEITEAGQVLVDHAMEILARTGEAAMGFGTVAEHRLGGELTLGSPSYTFTMPGRRELLRRFTDSNPNVTFQVRNAHTLQLLSQLRAGEIDVAMLLEPNDISGLTTIEIGSMTSILFLPKSHSLAREPTIELSKLVGVKIATWKRDINPDAFDRVFGPLAQAGAVLVPLNGVLTTGMTEAAAVLDLVTLGDRTGRIPDNYVSVPLSSPISSQIVLAASNDKPWSSALERFWEIAQDIFPSH